MCLFSKEIRSPCSSFTSSRLHRNLDESVTSRSRVVCQEALKMIFISSNIELQIYGLKLVSLRTYECTGSTQSVGELTGSVQLSPVATIPRLTVATAPPLTVDAELTRSGRLSSTASPSPPTETTSPPWVYRLPHLERVTVSRVLVPPVHCRPSPNADSRSIMFFKFVDLSALSSSFIIFRVTVKVKAIHVSDLSTGLRLTSAPIPPLNISFNYLNRSLFLLWNEGVVLSLMLFLPQFEDVAAFVGFFMKLYLPQFIQLAVVVFFTAFRLHKHGFVASVFVAVRSPAVHVKILPTDLVNAMWFKAFKIGGFGWSIYGKGEARNSQGSSISLSAGSSLANEAGKMIEALQSAKTRRLSSLQLTLDSIVLFSAMRSWLDMIKITATCFAVAFTMSVRGDGRDGNSDPSPYT
ncbi:hypothetical protein HID58_079894 [Brassica napus]|uniref:Uncharacterized protein n=1 Tax=Brassica napus TaxID=3708 RepID=A0ABQ7Y3B7_BRANA|nr:hypothetical protein HID58_079894 [Brassica napus]